MRKKLYKAEKGKKISGVCAGFADFFEIDVTIIRIIWLFAVLCVGTGFLAYIICALVMPNESDIDKNVIDV